MTKYEKLDKEINELIQQQKLIEVINLIKEELQNNYVPIKFYDKWNDLVNHLQILLNQNQIEQEKLNFINNLKETDLMSNILVDNKINLFFLEVYAQKFKNIDELDQINIFQTILLSSSISQSQKFILLQFLLNKTTYIYWFYNTLIKQKQEINQEVLNEFNLTNQLIKKEINNLLNKDITLQKICFDLLNLISLYYFPFSLNKIIKKTYKTIAQELIEYTKQTFYTTKLDKKYNWIVPIINYFDKEA